MIVNNLTLKTPLQVCGPLICRSSDFSFDNAQCCGNLNHLNRQFKSYQGSKEAEISGSILDWTLVTVSAVYQGWAGEWGEHTIRKPIFAS